MGKMGIFMVGLAMCACAGAAADVTVADARGTLFKYKADGVAFKPYVQELYTPSGINVIRDNVADHIHHHGLMNAVFADGVDFWAETEKCGKQLDKGLTQTAQGIDQQLDWVDGSGKVILHESRSVKGIRLTGPKATLVKWQSVLSAPEGKREVTLTGSHYTGVGMRFVKSMDTVGSYFNSDGVEGELVRGDERNFQARWSAYTAPVDGKDVTVVMFDDAKNPRPATWFTMKEAFAYMSATLHLNKEPFTIEAGKPATLTYYVGVFDGKAGKDSIETLYKQLPR